LARTFTDSEGKQREYPGVLDAQEQDEYRIWWEAQVMANAKNHAKPIEKASEVDYDAIVASRGVDIPDSEA